MPTSCPDWLVYFVHFPIRSLQYSRKNFSTYSCPRPPPNLPWVPVLRILYSAPKSIWIHSRTPSEMDPFGHQAPPNVSVRTLKKNGEKSRLPTVVVFSVSALSFFMSHSSNFNRAQVALNILFFLEKANI